MCVCVCVCVYVCVCVFGADAKLTVRDIGPATDRQLSLTTARFRIQARNLAIAQCCTAKDYRCQSADEYFGRPFAVRLLLVCCPMYQTTNVPVHCL